MTAYEIGLYVEPVSGRKPFGHVVIGIPENQFLELKADCPDQGFKGQNPKVAQAIKEGITKDEREWMLLHLGLRPGTECRFTSQGIVPYIDEAKEKPHLERNGRKFWVFRHHF